MRENDFTLAAKLHDLNINHKICAHFGHIGFNYTKKHCAAHWIEIQTGRYLTLRR